MHSDSDRESLWAIKLSPLLLHFLAPSTDSFFPKKSQPLCWSPTLCKHFLLYLFYSLKAQLCWDLDKMIQCIPQAHKKHDLYEKWIEKSQRFESTSILVNLGSHWWTNSTLRSPATTWISQMEDVLRTTSVTQGHRSQRQPVAPRRTMKSAAIREETQAKGTNWWPDGTSTNRPSNAGGSSTRAFEATPTISSRRRSAWMPVKTVSVWIV